MGSKSRRLTIAGMAFATGLVPLAAHGQTPDPPGISGDWGGVRSDLQSRGWTFNLRDKFEAGDVLSGGRRLATGANEVRLGLKGDLEKAFGWKGGKIGVDFTRRSGSSLGPSSGLDPLMPFIEVHGRGDIWRLTNLWYSQDLPAGLNLKLGRDNPGADFDKARCRFQNLTFCGSAPGNLVGRYWHNWPVSQWGARLKLTRGPAYLEAGAYQVNPGDLVHGFHLSPSGGRGVLVPFEAGWTPKLGDQALPGDYKLGGWWSDVTAPDVLLATDGRPQAVTGAPPAQRRGRYGFYMSGRQQVTGAPDGKGLTLFARFAHADRRTSRLDRQVSLGAAYQGLFPGRSKDTLAIAFGVTHVNDRAALEDALLAPEAPRPGSEYVTEVDYRVKAFGGATFTPNLQWVRHAGGIGGRDGLVLGLKTVLNF